MNASTIESLNAQVAQIQSFHARANRDLALREECKRNSEEFRAMAEAADAAKRLRLTGSAKRWTAADIAGWRVVDVTTTFGRRARTYRNTIAEFSTKEAAQACASKLGAEGGAFHSSHIEVKPIWKK